MEFTTVIELGGKTATGFAVPDEVVEALGTSKRPAVVVAIGDYTYRSTVARMGGRFMVPLAAEHREPAGVAAGDEITVGIELDTAPREAEVPDDLAEALAAASGARAAFDGLAPSRRKEWVRTVVDAKKPETRAARIAKTVDAVSPGA